MKQLVFLLPVFLIFGCSDNLDTDRNTRMLSVEDIKREYHIANKLNNLEDRSRIDTSTVVLGIDKRNGKTIIRTCQMRGFGCYVFWDYFTIKYQDCDSGCCKKSEGAYWLVDYVGIAGSPAVVGCVPDTVSASKN